jgi:UPF0755 protein
MTARPPRPEPPPAEPDLRDEDADEYVDHPEADDAESRTSRRAAREAERADRRRRRRRSFAALGIVSLLVVPFLVAGGWLVYQLNPPGEPGRLVQIKVEPGWGVSEIGDELESKEVIGSSLAFQLYARARGAGPFQDGPYQLREDLGVRDAVSKLEEGPSQGRTDIELTIPPGLTLQEIAERVEQQLPGRTAEKFLEVANSGVVRSRYQPAEVTSLEGLLFPDTYLFAKAEDEEDVIRELVGTFDEKADAAGVAAGAAAIGRTPYEAIVIASLIEREAGVEEDRPLISAVVANRLRDGMPLQIDATLCYIKGGCTEPLSNADKELDSPYNTYRVAALPPTPISSVGEASMRAAVAPAAVPYKFYVLGDASGAHAFAETAEEHEANVQAAREKGLL